MLMTSVDRGFGTVTFAPSGHCHGTSALRSPSHRSVYSALDGRCWAGLPDSICVNVGDRPCIRCFPRRVWDIYRQGEEDAGYRHQQQGISVRETYSFSGKSKIVMKSLGDLLIFLLQVGNSRWRHRAASRDSHHDWTELYVDVIKGEQHEIIRV